MKAHRTIPIALIVLPGCSWIGVNQAPLASDGFTGPPPGRSLVVGPGLRGGADGLQGRNDDTLGVRPSGLSLYYGKNGELLYPDGTPVPFKGVTRQLQDLRAQERIR